MANSAQHRGRTSRIRLGASEALTLAVVLMLGVVATQSAQAQTFTVLYNFTGSSDGENPDSALIRDAAGNLYGTTYGGGSYRGGAVFKVDTGGTETVLYSFCRGGYPCPDGALPSGGVMRDAKGNFYGITPVGGASGAGVVYKLSKAGNETVLHSFTATEGAGPYAGLVPDAAGNFYGTAYYGGSDDVGTVFKLDSSGRLTVLHSFTGGSSDGAYPYYGSSVLDKGGNLYGVTSEGGASGEGVVYKLSKNGTLTVLHSFTGGSSDGCTPYGTPALDKKGDLYGTAAGCGFLGEGIVWKVSKKGTETVLHSFAGGTSDGAFPFAGVILDAKGNLYGDTYWGGGTGCYGHGCGTVYRLSKTGTLTLLHSFDGSDGAYLIGGVIRDAKGNVYGTAAGGGSGSGGTVWKLTPVVTMARQ